MCTGAGCLSNSACKDFFDHGFNVSHWRVIDLNDVSGSTRPVLLDDFRINHVYEVFHHLHIHRVGLNPKRIQSCVRNDRDGSASTGSRSCCAACTAATAPATSEQAPHKSAAAKETGCNIAKQSAATATVGCRFACDDTLDKFGCGCSCDVFQIKYLGLRWAVCHLLLRCSIELIEFLQFLWIITGDYQSVRALKNLDLVIRR